MAPPAAADKSAESGNASGGPPASARSTGSPRSGKSRMTKKQSEEYNQFRSFEAEGDTCRRKGEYAKAVESYTRALSMRAGDRTVLLYRSHCYSQLGLHAQAVDDADATIRDDPKFYRGLYQKAETLYAAGDFEFALVYYHRGKKARPDLKDCELGIHKCTQAIFDSIAQPDLDKELKKVPFSALLSSVHPGTPLRGNLEATKSLPNASFLTQIRSSRESDARLSATTAASASGATVVSFGSSSPTKSGAIPTSSSSVSIPKLQLTDLRASAPAGTASASWRSSISQRSARPPGAVSSRKLLGQLYADKRYLRELMNDEVLHREITGKPSNEIVKTIASGVEFLDVREEFWRQQIPPSGADDEQTSLLGDVAGVASARSKSARRSVPRAYDNEDDEYRLDLDDDDDDDFGSSSRNANNSRNRRTRGGGGGQGADFDASGGGGSSSYRGKPNTAAVVGGSSGIGSLTARRSLANVVSGNSGLRDSSSDNDKSRVRTAPASVNPRRQLGPMQSEFGASTLSAAGNAASVYSSSGSGSGLGGSRLPALKSAGGGGKKPGTLSGGVAGKSGSGTTTDSELESMLHATLPKKLNRKKVVEHTRYAVEKLESINECIATGDLDQALNTSKGFLARLPVLEIGDKPKILGNIYSLMGTAYLELNKPTLAVIHHRKDLDIAIRYDNKQAYVRALGNLGLTYEKMREYAQAVRMWEKKLEHVDADPTLLEAENMHVATILEDIGRCYYEMGEFDKAVQYVQRILDTARSSNDRAREMSAHFTIGHTRMKMRRFPEAAQSFEAYLRIARELNDRIAEANALTDLGNVYLQLGDVSRSITLQQEAIAISSQLYRGGGGAGATKPGSAGGSSEKPLSTGSAGPARSSLISGERSSVGGVASKSASFAGLTNNTNAVNGATNARVVGSSSGDVVPFPTRTAPTSRYAKSVTTAIGGLSVNDDSSEY